MRVVKSVPGEEIVCRGSIKDSDVARFVKAFAEDPLIVEEEAEALFALNKACAIQAPAWSTFFVDALAEHFINHAEPEGYVTAPKAAWLISRISNDGWVGSRAELDLLLAILARSRWVPLSLATFALDQVKGAVRHGCGPLRAGQASRPGIMFVQDVALIRKILLAFGSDTSLAVTRAEAEILLEINAVVTWATAPLAWSDLFIKAIANVILASQGYAVPERSLALARNSDLAASSHFEEMVTSSLAWVRREYPRPSSQEAALAKLERQRIEIVTQEQFYSREEATWVEQRFLSSGLSNGSGVGAEGQIVNYLRREGLIAEQSQLYAPVSGGRAA